MVQTMRKNNTCNEFLGKEQHYFSIISALNIIARACNKGRGCCVLFFKRGTPLFQET